MPDTYADFAALAAAEPPCAFAIFARDLGTSVVVAAPHGGAIEPGTSEIARSVAGDDLSCYLFEGTRPADNARLHITSTRFDEPRCLSLLGAAQRVITVHGEAGGGEVVYVGGLERAAVEALRAALADRGYRALEHPDADLQGLHPRNLCNLGQSGAGVQLEISKGLRRTLFASLDRAGRARPTARLPHFARTVRSVLLPGER
jgi:phage replication-related protein YjqB (UPF0714/DUF867 family)